MVEKTTSLTEQMHTYTEKITDYQEVFEKTIVELKDTTEKNTHLQTAISYLLDKMTTERQEFEKC